MPQMSPTELKALLQAARSASLGGPLTSDLSTERAKALDYYNGDMTEDMPSAEGRSKAISTDVADTIEGLMPSLMEIFGAGEEVVRFDPVGPEDEEAARQETDYVNHVFMQKNPGWMVLYTFIKDALLSKNGIVKVYWDESEKEERETYHDQPDDAFAIMASDPDAEIVEHTEHKDPQTGEVTHDVTLMRKKSYGCAVTAPVPPEEFGIHRNARTIKDAIYCFHEPANITETDLIEQGFDEDQVKALPTYGNQENEEQIARDTLHEEQGATDAMNRAVRHVRMIEHYIRMDYEGNGKPILYKVSTGGNQLDVLRRDGKEDVVPVDDDRPPFAAQTPIIITHRFHGKSIADIVTDIQQIKTALLRGYLDNTYMLNNARTEVSESHAHEQTINDLLTNRPGGIVRTKMPGGLNPMPVNSIGPAILPALEYFDATREWRTGVTRQGQGIDANALQNQSATAVNQAFTAAQARMKLIARIFAETGVRDLFSLLHGCIRRNDSKANTVRLRNKWVTVDPRDWKERNDMTINVGLGTGSRQDELMFLTNVLNVQKEIILTSPPGSPFLQLVEPKNVYNTLEKMIERGGLKTVEPYFTDPAAPDPMTGQPKQPPPPPPDPKMMEIQLKNQIEQTQAQADIATQNNKTQSEITVQNNKTQAELALAQKKFELEYQLKMMEAQMKQEAHQHEMAARQQDMARSQQDYEKQQTDASVQHQKSSEAIAGPISDMLAQVGSHLAQTHAQHAQMLADVLTKATAPKRARKGPDGSWTVEAMPGH